MEGGNGKSREGKRTEAQGKEREGKGDGTEIGGFVLLALEGNSRP